MKEGWGAELDVFVAVSVLAVVLVALAVFAGFLVLDMLDVLAVLGVLSVVVFGPFNMLVVVVLVALPRLSLRLLLVDLSVNREEKNPSCFAGFNGGMSFPCLIRISE